MNKKILIVAALQMVVCVGGAFAWAIGIQGGGGYPAGGGAAVTFKLDSLPLVFAADAAIYSNAFMIGLTGDYWFLNDTLVDTGIGPLGWFLGAGAGVGLWLGDDIFGIQLAARLPIGLNMMIPVGSIEIEPYIQVVPTLGANLMYGDIFHFGVAGNLGLRFHF